MELTISQKTFSADRATKGKNAGTKERVNRRDFSSPVQYFSFLTPTRMTSEIRLKQLHSDDLALPRGSD